VSDSADGEETPDDEEFAAFVIDIADRYVNLDRGIRRRTDPKKPVHGPQPDGGVHDDMVNACRLILIENKDKITKAKYPKAYAKSLLQVVPALHSYRTSGWKLSEWDSKQLHRAWELARRERPDAETLTQTLLARQYYVDAGGSPWVFDRVHGEPLSLFDGGEFEDDDYQGIVDLLPDPAPGPEELVTDPKPGDMIERTIEEYMQEAMDEADREFVALLVEYKRQGLEQQDVARVLHMAPYAVTRRTQRIQADYQTWKATEAVEDSPEESGESRN